MRYIAQVRSAFILGVLSFFLMSCERGQPLDLAAEPDGVIQSQIWPDDPQRLVSMAPNITEALFALGMGERVVAVTRYCDYPPEVKDLPKIGGMLDPDLEAILNAKPDLVLGDIQGADHRIAKRLERAGVAYGFLEMNDLASVREGISTLGRWLDDESAARKSLDSLESELARVSEQVKKMPKGSGERALLIYDREPLVAAGPGTFGDDLLELAGLQNALDKNERSYPILDIEALLGLDPDWIFDIEVSESSREAQRFWERFKGLKASQRGQIIYLNDPVVVRPGPRLPEALELLGQAFQELAGQAEEL